VLLEITSPLLERFTKPILIIPGLQAFARDVERRYRTISSLLGCASVKYRKERH
jgi:hypothetical protein